jgi:hypothetical protein
VLVLHIKRFGYDERGSSKLHQAIAFQPRLRVRAAWMTDDCPDRKAGCEYQLLASIIHHGRNATGGGTGGVGVVTAYLFMRLGERGGWSGDGVYLCMRLGERGGVVTVCTCSARFGRLGCLLCPPHVAAAWVARVLPRPPSPWRVN